MIRILGSLGCGKKMQRHGLRTVYVIYFNFFTVFLSHCIEAVIAHRMRGSMKKLVIIWCFSYDEACLRRLFGWGSRAGMDFSCLGIFFGRLSIGYPNRGKEFGSGDV